MIINGKEENIATPITVAELIESKGLRADRVAVDVGACSSRLCVRFCRIGHSRLVRKKGRRRNRTL